MKLSRISLIVALVLVAMVALTCSANAYSNNDLVGYLTTTHVIGGNQYRLSDANCATVKYYLAKYPVTDEQAAQVKAYLDQAKSKANAIGSVEKMSAAQEAEIISLFQQAGAVVGVSVTFDTQNKIATVSKNGTVILSGSYANYSSNGLIVKFSAGGSDAPSAGTAAPAAGTASNGSSKTFVYTGADNTVFVVLALLAVVAVSTISVKKAYAK